MIVNGKEIARVFPRRTKATPDDALAFTGPLPRAIRETGGGIDEVHVSVTFTYDIPKAEKLVKSWERLGVPVKIGGPAFGDRSGDFTPGLYMNPPLDFGTAIALIHSELSEALEEEREGRPMVWYFRRT